uniref:Aldo_ket_red domain-containing protein n=1 Tax=Steinernema glaseri TaxID=37863 RepID=A0A1I7YE75_9BILA
MFAEVPRESRNTLQSETVPFSQYSEGYGSYGSPDSEERHLGIAIKPLEEPILESYSFDYLALHSPIKFKTIDQVIEDSKNWPYQDMNLWEVLPIIPKNGPRDGCLKSGSSFGAKNESEVDDSFDWFSTSPVEEGEKEGDRTEEERILDDQTQFEFDPFTEGDKFEW